MPFLCKMCHVSVEKEYLFKNQIQVISLQSFIIINIASNNIKDYLSTYCMLGTVINAFT